ncbi:MAG: hypothetical protein ABIF04_05555 [Chloroflexota bacterium]
MAASVFLINQERQMFFEGEFDIFGIAELFLQAIGEGWQVQLREFVEQGLD